MNREIPPSPSIDTLHPRNLRSLSAQGNSRKERQQNGISFAPFSRRFLDASASQIHSQQPDKTKCLKNPRTFPFCKGTSSTYLFIFSTYPIEMGKQLLPFYFRRLRGRCLVRGHGCTLGQATDLLQEAVGQGEETHRKTQKGNQRSTQKNILKKGLKKEHFELYILADDRPRGLRPLPLRLPHPRQAQVCANI